MAKLVRIIYCIYAFVLFLAIMLVIVTPVIIASLFGKVKGGNIIYDICRAWADTWLFLIGISHKNIYESPHDTAAQYIFVSNHISYLDVPIILKTIRKQHFRALGKSELGAIPVFGFIFKQAAVSVDRKNPENRAKSLRTLKSIINRKISVLIFPEGTFNITGNPLKDFYDGAFKIAIETQTPLKPLLLLNTNQLLDHKSIFSLNPGRTYSVFLEETSTAGLSLEDVAALKVKVYKQMEEALVRYNKGPIADPRKPIA